MADCYLGLTIAYLDPTAETAVNRVLRRRGFWMDTVVQSFVIVAFGLAVLSVAIRTGFRLAQTSRSLDDRVARVCRDRDVDNAADMAADEDTNGFPLAW